MDTPISPELSEAIISKRRTEAVKACDRAKDDIRESELEALLKLHGFATQRLLKDPKDAFYLDYFRRTAELIKETYARMEGEGVRELEADIAVAPELLEALEGIVFAWDECKPSTDTLVHPSHYFLDRIANARAAIKKARGETP